MGVFGQGKGVTLASRVRGYRGGLGAVSCWWVQIGRKGASGRDRSGGEFCLNGRVERVYPLQN